jgi:hypothetical protein
MLLAEFQTAWYQQKAEHLASYGEHIAPGERVGGPGDPIGVIPFNFEEHDVADIELFSLETRITGQYQVTEKVPRNSSETTVVLDYAIADREDPHFMTAAKRSMGALLVDSIIESKPAEEDKVSLYIVGDAKAPRLPIATLLRGTEDPLAKAQAIGRLSGDKLIVVSTYKELDPAAIKPRQRSTSKLGIRINHPYEIALEVGKGKLKTGNPQFAVVNRKKPDEVERWNNVLQQDQADVMLRGRKAGFAMVQLVASIEHKRTGFLDPTQTDITLAKAYRPNLRRNR